MLEKQLINWLLLEAALSCFIVTTCTKKWRHWAASRECGVWHSAWNRKDVLPLCSYWERLPCSRLLMTYLKGKFVALQKSHFYKLLAFRRSNAAHFLSWSEGRGRGRRLEMEWRKRDELNAEVTSLLGRCRGKVHRAVFLTATTVLVTYLSVPQ